MKSGRRLGPSFRLRCSAFGVRFAILADSLTTFDRVRDRLPPSHRVLSDGWAARTYTLKRTLDAEGRRRWVVDDQDGRRVSSPATARAALDALESDLHLYVAEHATRHTFVHAGVVGWKGRAIVIPGRSHSGKSTLVMALVRAGARYYSDEYAVLDDRGRVRPYPRPLALRRRRAPARRFGAQALGVTSAPGPILLGAVVVTRYRTGARWRPRPLSYGRGLLALLQHTVSARSQSRDALARLGRAVGPGTRVLSGERGEAAAVAPVLLDFMEDVISAREESGDHAAGSERRASRSQGRR